MPNDLPRPAHPLSDHAWSVLARLGAGDVPYQEINPGVCRRLREEALAIAVEGPSPYRTVPGKVGHLRITEAGRARLRDREAAPVQGA